MCRMLDQPTSLCNEVHNNRAQMESAESDPVWPQLGYGERLSTTRLKDTACTRMHKAAQAIVERDNAIPLQLMQFSAA